MMYQGILPFACTDAIHLKSSDRIMKTPLLTFVLALLALSPVTSWGDSFQVASNLTTFGLSVAADAEGDFVVVWDKSGGDGNGYGIFARLFDKTGNPRGSDFQVNTYSIGDQQNPAVAMSSNGNFIVVWESNGEDGSGLGVFARRYGAAGQPLGGGFQVNTTTNGNQITPRVTMDAAGESAIVWESGRIFAQRYGANGQRLSGEFQVDSGTGVGVAYPDVVMSDLGAFLVVWQRYDGGSATSVRAHAFSNSGAGTGIELLIGNGTLDLFPRIDMDAGGNFVVAWKSIDSTYARLFNADSPDGFRSVKLQNQVVHGGHLLY